MCEWEAAPNQYRRSRLRVCPEYWPYAAEAPSAGREVATQSPRVEASAYVAEVRRMFREPACVQGRFGPADERLAADWQRAGVSLATVQRAILLGSVRKSMSLLDRPDGEPVRSPALLRQLAAGGADGIVPGIVLAALGVQPTPLRAGRGGPAGGGCQKCLSRFGTGRSALERSGDLHLPPAKPERRRDDDDLLLRYNHCGR